MIKGRDRKTIHEALEDVEKDKVVIIEKDKDGYHILGTPKNPGADCREMRNNFLKMKEDERSVRFIGKSAGEDCAMCKKREKCKEENFQEAS